MLRPQADPRQHVAAPPRGARQRHSRVLIEQRLLQDRADLLARVERAIGVLEDDLHVRRSFFSAAAVGVRDVDAVDQQRPRVGGSIIVTSRASVDLPQPDSPTTASVLPASTVERRRRRAPSRSPAGGTRRGLAAVVARQVDAPRERRSCGSRPVGGWPARDNGTAPARARRGTGRRHASRTESVA